MPGKFFIGTPEHVPLLESLLRDKYVRRNAIEAIEQIYKRSTPKLRSDRVLPSKREEKVLPVKLFSGQTLHILHISDIHYAFEKDPTITCIFHEFLEDIKKWRGQQNNTKIQAICLTGDIAQKGQKDQYDSINDKINALLNLGDRPILRPILTFSSRRKARRWNPDSGKWTVYDDDGNNRFPFPHSTVLINRE
ncbi:hypothetical protein ACFLRT_04680 [Acidobacteriota bacterium]